MTAEEFIGRIIRHIPNKGHRMIRYSGLFASRIKSKMLLVVQNLLSKGQQAMVYIKQEPLSWREMIIKCTGVDPYECKKCGSIMELTELVIAIKSGGTKTIFLREVDCSP